MAHQAVPEPIYSMSNTVSTPAGDGIVTWQDNNETAVILDDGLEYIFNDEDVAESTGNKASLRQSFWNRAQSYTDDFFEACDIYSSLIKKYTRMVNNAGKTCSKCKEFKSFDNFHASSESNDGLRPDCKECRRS